MPKIPTYVTQTTDPVPAPPASETVRGVTLTERVLENLRTGAKVRPCAMVESLGISKGHVHYTLSQLVALGFVEHVPTHYKLTRKAKKYYDEHGLWPDEVYQPPRGLYKTLKPNGWKKRKEGKK